MAEGNFEAKVSAKRETSSGIFLTLQIQPDDYTADLATLRVGSALVIGWAEVVNTAVEPIEESPVRQMQPPTKADLATIGAPKERKPFDSLPLSQQAALRCQDNDFKIFLGVKSAEEAADHVRRCCGVVSRSELDKEANTLAREWWGNMEDGFQDWLTTNRYADSRR